MSKRAERAALKAYPPETKKAIELLPRDWNEPKRTAFIQGYEQAEKETIDRAAEWFRTHWREYIMGPDADGCVGFGHWENDFKKAMEED